MEFRRAPNGIGFLICIDFNARKLIAIAPIDELLDGCQFLDLAIFVLHIVQLRYVLFLFFWAASTAAVARFGLALCS